MFHKSILAVGLTIIASLAVANPIRKDIIHERQYEGVEPQAAPAYCQIIGNERGALIYRYLDVSDDCKNAGLGNECCVSVMTKGAKRPWTEQDRNDLMAAIAGQSKKTGRFDRTRYGDWTATFDTILFTDNTLVNSELLQVWFNTIKNLQLSSTAGTGNMVFQIRAGTDSISNYMVLMRKAT